MKQRLTRIGPHQAGKVLSLVYFLMGLIVAPILLFAAFFGKDAGLGSVLLALAIPFLYGAFGYLGTALAALLYNLVARLAGGLEVTLEAVEPQRTP